MTVEQIRTPSQVRTAESISQATAVEQARAVAEVAAAVKVAQEFPRDTGKALAQMQEACRHMALAERAFYSVPRGGGRIEGATVHLARELARCWGNVDYGVRETRRDDDQGISEMQAWAWDQETNVRSVRSFIVPHDRMVGRAAEKRRERLVDLGDIANNNNSVAARAVRETIYTILPTWFVEQAKDLAAKTLNDGGGQPLEQQVAEAIAYFGSLGVAQAQLEARLDRPRQQWTAQDLGVLRVIDAEIRRGEKRPEDEFPAPERRPVTAAEIAGQAAESEPPAEPQPDLITDAQQRKIRALFSTLDLKDRTEQLAYYWRVTGRVVETSKSLTKVEAGQILDDLQRAEKGEPNLIDPAPGDGAQ